MKHRLAVTILLSLCCSCSSPAGTVEEDLLDLQAISEILEDISDTQAGIDLELQWQEVPLGCEGSCAELPDVRFDQEESSEEGGFGWSCQGNEECLSGYCLNLGHEKACSISCVEECPEGWSCEPDMAALPDIIFLCVPTGITYCSPCQGDEDCRLGSIDVGSACVSHGASGAFCGKACESDTDCGAGSNCQESTLVDETTRWQCVPVEGECACSTWAVEKNGVTACALVNEFGTCPGQRGCTEDGLTDCEAHLPGAEICNGLDDDCDGEVDEEMGQTTCGLGNCEHTVENCVAGKAQKCDPLEGAVKNEECNNEDDDCDGVVDNGLPDTDGDGTPDCLDYDDDDDGWLDQQDNCPLTENPGQEDFDLDTIGDLCDPDDDDDKSPDGVDCEPFNDAVYPKKSESCNGIDDNCSGVVDEGLGETTCGLGECLKSVANCELGEVQVCDSFAGALPEECDGLDNDCDGIEDDGFDDLDGDQEADCVDDDDDGDGVLDGDDNCPVTANDDQSDVDEDGFGDLCDFGCFIFEVDGWEVDCDGLPDDLDNCPGVANPEQADTDSDSVGDACDPDDDGDGVPDDPDNCPLVSNPGQQDLDADGVGDLCDGDLDGDGVLDGDDNCLLVANKAQSDNDKDGSGDECDPDDDNDTDPDIIDCAPMNPFVSHLATESCNEIDDDCDSIIDEEDADGCVLHYLDIDFDKYGVTGQSKCLCAPDDLYTALDGGDCKPLDDSINPGQAELCNGSDDDCNGAVDEGFVDTDEDGQANCIDPDDDDDGLSDDGDNCPLVVNEEQLDFDLDGLGDECDGDDDDDGALDEDDCQPHDADVFPGNQEICDGKDSDCNEEIDDGLGETTCGLGLCEHTVANCVNGEVQECDPLAGAQEEVCNALDDNCDGDVDEDFEVGVFCIIGLGQCQDEGVTACLEDGSGVYCVAELGEEGIEFCNGKDDDCDGFTDEELGTTTCGLGECEHTIDNCVAGLDQVCDPLAGSVAEVCDGKDNDCNGEVDDELGMTTCGLGECEHSIDFCLDGQVQPCDAFEGAVDEECNTLDDDCNGEIDDGLGTTTCGLGKCEHTIDNCVAGEVQECDPMEGSIGEVCNNADEDCDGVIDNGVTEPCSTVCEAGVKTCVAGQFGDCDAQIPVTEVCDKVDNDCDGATDEGWSAKCQDITCSGNGHIQTIPDGCMDDGGSSSGGDAMQVFCCHGIARFCLSGEACPWRNGCIVSNDTCSRAGLGSDYMANASCSYYKGHANYYCNTNKQIYF
jgi:hypothetical protein